MNTFNVIPELADLHYYLSYKEPLFNIGSEKTRNSVLKRIMKAFEINLNSIKFNNDFPSDKFYSFTKFYGDTFVEIAIGIQEFSVKINRFFDEDQAIEILNKAFNTIKNIKGFEILRQRFTLAQHYSSDDDLNKFFKDLNPVVPIEFADKIKSQGVVYKLSDDNTYQLSLLIDTSLAFPGGLYINADIFFNPNGYGFTEAIKFAKDEYKKITLALCLKEI